MSCLTCSTHLLRSFLYAFDVQQKQLLLLPRHIVRTSQRRSLNTSPNLHIDTTPTRSLGHEAINTHSLKSFDNVYLPFDISIKVPAVPQIIPFQYGSATPKSNQLFNSNGGAQQHSDSPSALDSPGAAEDVIHKLNTRLRDGPRHHRVTGTGASAKRPIKYGVADRMRDSSLKQANTERRPRSFPTTGSKAVWRLRISSERGSQKATEDQKPFAPRELWQVQKKALGEKFGESGWQPRKRLSPDALDGIRALHAQYPEDYSTSKLADHFKVSPEAIRRILKSKWRPSEVEDASRRDRWQKRGEAIWSQMVELGVKPPKKWREMGIGNSSALPTERLKPRTGASRIGESLVALGGVPEAVMATSQEGRGYSRRALSDRIL